MLQAVIVGAFINVVMPLLGMGLVLAIFVGVALARYLRGNPAQQHHGDEHDDRRAKLTVIVGHHHEVSP